MARVNGPKQRIPAGRSITIQLFEASGHGFAEYVVEEGRDKVTDLASAVGFAKRSLPRTGQYVVVVSVEASGRFSQTHLALGAS